MNRLTALRAYAGAYMAARRPGGTFRDARQWMEQTRLSAHTAADLDALGYTPTVVSYEIERAYEAGDERDSDRVVDAMLYGLPHRTVTLTHGAPEYTALLHQIRADRELVKRIWADAESRPAELDNPGTLWTVTLVDDGDQEVPAAWAAARIEDGTVKAFCNYEVPHRRGRGLYTAAYQVRHRDVIEPAAQGRAVTYLFGQPPGTDRPYGTPIAQHVADGWQLSGQSGPGELGGHTWYELCRG